MTLVGLGIVATLAWAGLASAMMTPLGPLMMPMDAEWDAGNVAAIYTMWALMMAAMMLPSATPMIMTYGTISQQKGAQSKSIIVFVVAYMLIWAGFSILATLMHWGLQATGLLSPMGASTSRVLSGVLLLIAGAYQFTPLKRTCLRHCRTPWGFLMTEWREGMSGALVMGLRHGLICLGCCWVLMGLLFAFGVMNLLWVGVLATAIVIEKIAPAGERVSRAFGAMLIILGLGLIVFR